MSDLKIGAVILSRFSSSRLPGKALMEIQDKKVLQYIVERLSTVFAPDEIVIATSSEASDDPIAAFCQSNGIGCYRGSLENVALRFLEAAESQGWDFAARINGDNIFVDTQVLSQMLETARTNRYDFVSNVKDRTYPKGMSIEIVRTEFFRKLMPEIAASPYYREHVTIYLYDNEADINQFYDKNTILPEAAGLQFALDTLEDFDRTEKIIGKFEGSHEQYNLKEIFEIYRKLVQ